MAQSIRRVSIRCFLTVGIEHPTKAFTALNRLIDRTDRGKRAQQSIPYPLMITLAVIVCNTFSECPAQRCLTEKNLSIQTFILCGTHKSLGD